MPDQSEMPSILLVGTDLSLLEGLAQSLSAQGHGTRVATSFGEAREMTASMRGLASELDTGVLVCLEGGYAPRALAASVVETIAALSDGRAPRGAPSEPAEPHLSRVRERVRGPGGP